MLCAHCNDVLQMKPCKHRVAQQSTFWMHLGIGMMPPDEHQKSQDWSRSESADSEDSRLTATTGAASGAEALEDAAVHVGEGARSEIGACSEPHGLRGDTWRWPPTVTRR